MDSKVKKAKKPNNRLRMERKNRGWSQARLAEMIGADNSLISRWECGERSPEPTYQERLCNLFQKSASELGFIDTSNDANTHSLSDAFDLSLTQQEMYLLLSKRFIMLA